MRSQIQQQGPGQRRPPAQCELCGHAARHTHRESQVHACTQPSMHARQSTCMHMRAA